MTNNGKNKQEKTANNENSYNQDKPNKEDN